MKVVHSWLKEYVGEALPTPDKIEDLLNFHAFEVDGIAEVEGESVIDVDVLPNRSSDCLCHRGIARELASILNASLAHDPLRVVPHLVTTDKISIDIENPEHCPRFSAALISGITVKESPLWLQTRLRALGQRSINNIVDATNYVMYGIGQPLHAYDADLFPQVNGQWHFSIRSARVGETVSLLPEGGKTEDRVVELQGTELLIVDKSSDTPIGLAGVKGGRYAGVHEGTTSIIIESAHFHPILTRKTARRLGIVIDASKRFENEPSRELPLYAQHEIITLIIDIAGGTFEGIIDEYPNRLVVPQVIVPVVQVNALLGLTLSIADMQALLLRVGVTIIEAPESESGSFLVSGPWERTDLTIAEDFIEEIGRIHGLQNIVSIVPPTTSLQDVNVRQFYTEKIRQHLLMLGFSEVITSSFAKKGEIQLQNALASDKSYVRGDLKKNIEQVLVQNFTHGDLLGLSDIRAFEIGTVFSKTETSVTEHVALTLGIRTKGNGPAPKDDVLLTEVCESLKSILGAETSFVIEKGIVEINLSAIFPLLPVPLTYDVLQPKITKTYRPVSLYPAVARDIALWVTETTDPLEVETTIKGAAGGLLVRLNQFDTFTKDGRTSYAFRLIFQSFERTLTDVEVNVQMEQVYNEVATKDWEVR